MEKQPGRIIEQLQNVQLRQRRVIQQLQADNARILSDLVEVRQERDAFRDKAARVRRENAELQNRLDEILTEFQDVKRERATLVRSVTSTTQRENSMRSRSPCPSSKVFNTFSVLNEEQTETLPITETTTATVENKLRPYVRRELPNPLELGLPRSDPVPTVTTACDDSGRTPLIQLDASYYCSSL